MAKKETFFRLIVEEFDRTVNTEVVNIYNYWLRENSLVVYTKDAGQKERTETVYALANFRSLTLEPMENE